MNDLIATPYADAIFQIALSKNKLEEFYHDFELIQTVINEEFIQLLKNPNITKSEKLMIVEQSFNSVNHDIKNFLKLLVEKNRFAKIKAIIKMFFKKYYEYNKIQIVYVETAIELTQEQKEKLIAKFSKKYNKKIHLKISIDKTLLGGMRVIVEDTVYDNSVLNQLKRMKENV